MNLQNVQLRHGLVPSSSLDSLDYTVEMETGTGKTYVYLRTIFELNKRFGFTKFVVVVPSVAIREGVYKTLQITADHFRSLYSGTPFDYFIYDSAKLGHVRSFATNQHIQIMVVTVGAINKKAINNLYRNSDNTGGDKPIDLIGATRPVIIVDEPQSVDGGLQGRGKEALSAMKPLCTLRYSATHVDRYHMIYRLNAVDAYRRKLVKQIEVAAATVSHSHDTPYVRVLSTKLRRDVVSANLTLDVEGPAGVRRLERVVHEGDDLEQLTGRTVYQDFQVGEIRVEKDHEFVELLAPGGEHFLRIGESIGDVELHGVQRLMIRRTIEEHLAKEKRLNSQGIKVLSLFFIDSVGRYRRYDDEGTPVKEEYAKMFEEEYRRISNHPNYRSLFEGLNVDAVVGQVHDGYFSIDKNTGWVETAENNQANRDNAERGYKLIMRDKEKLLSLETPLKFIFSHSALREGWDNPNVFQICTLRDIRSERERRQTIGRGLRLCVNQNGERIHNAEINTLTVVAAESYEEFAANLQVEIENETGLRFGVVEENQFATIGVVDHSGQLAALGVEASGLLWRHFHSIGYIDGSGRIQDSLHDALRDNSLDVPMNFMGQRAQITTILSSLAGRVQVKNADERRQLRPSRSVLESAEFKELWDRIKYKTSYRVRIDSDHFLQQCAQALRDAPPIARAQLQWHTADIAIAQAGVELVATTRTAPVALSEFNVELPDVLTELQDRTQLTRRSIHWILSKSGRLDDFTRSPQNFVSLAAATINRCKNHTLVDNIKYQRLGDEAYYSQELFKDSELTGYLKNLLDATKATHEQIIYESEVEHEFAKQLELIDAVKVYAKLPPWFTVPTPLGGYNPDWAVLIDSHEGERLYFVVETKGSLRFADLRPTESAKIRCGMAHFKALETRGAPAKYVAVASIDDLLADVAGQ